MPLCGKKLTLEIKEIYSILESKNPVAISEKIKELYANYNKYRDSSQATIDKVFELSMEILGRGVAKGSAL